MSDLFIGSALSSIGPRGELALHESFCITIQSRAANDQLFIGLHEEDPCMIVYDRAGAVAQHRQHEAGLHAAGMPGASHAGRDGALRRAFGFVAPTRMDGLGRISIAPWMHSGRGKRARTLLVGMGHHFEIWNLDQVLEQGPGDLMMLATLHLAPSLDRKNRDEPSLQPVHAPRRARHAGQSGVPVQQMPALRQRPDSLRIVQP